MSDDDKFQLGWFRGRLPAERPTNGRRLKAALDWGRAMRGRYHGLMDGLMEPPPVAPQLPGDHVLCGKLGCGCVAILCPQSPDVLYLPGAGGCKIDHHAPPEPGTSNETPASVESSSERSNEPGPHDPVGLKPTDVGLFICCACGENPTPKYWIEDHWTGDRAEGERLVRAMIRDGLARQAEQGDAAETDDPGWLG